MTHDTQGPQDEPDELNDAAAAFGLQIVGPIEPADSPAFYLWPESVPLWNHWLQLQTQWNVSPMGQRTGLSYASAEAWLRAAGYGHGKRASLGAAMQDIAAMERASLEVWSKS